MIWDTNHVHDLEHLRFLVFSAVLPTTMEGADRLLASLSDVERARVAGMEARGRALQFLVGRACVRDALGSLFALAPRDVPIVVGPEGRPVLADPAMGREVSFAISHSGAEVSVGISAFGPLGVDVQQAIAGSLPIAERFLGPHAARWLAGLPEPGRGTAFAALWSIAEAIVGAGATERIELPSTYPPPGRGVMQGIAWTILPGTVGAAAAACPDRRGVPTHGVVVSPDGEVSGPIEMAPVPDAA